MPHTSLAQTDTQIGEEEPHIHWCWYQKPHMASEVGNYSRQWGLLPIGQAAGLTCCSKANSSETARHPLVPSKIHSGCGSDS